MPADDNMLLYHLGFNSPPLGAIQLGVRGISSPVYANLSKISLQYLAACGGDFLFCKWCNNNESIMDEDGDIDWD